MAVKTNSKTLSRYFIFSVFISIVIILIAVFVDFNFTNSMNNNAKIVCNNLQIINQSNAKLIRLIGGNLTWFDRYYSISPSVSYFRINESFNPPVLPLPYGRNMTTTSNSYYVSVVYTFYPPGNVVVFEHAYRGGYFVGHVSNTTLDFIIVNSSSASCSGLIYYDGHNIVKPYNPSSLLDRSQVISIAEKVGYKNISIALSQLTLINSTLPYNSTSPNYPSINNTYYDIPHYSTANILKCENATYVNNTYYDAPGYFVWGLEPNDSTAKMILIFAQNATLGLYQCR